MAKKTRLTAEQVRKAGHALGDDLASRGDPLAATLIHQEVERDYQERVPGTDTLRTLRRAREEILGLRQRNKVLTAQVRIVNVFEMALRTRSGGEGGLLGEDIAWALQREIARLDPPVKK